ncbi:MAG: hypothetical protein M3O06_11490, partial [Pseudomonadota bacterium]|nr:hypothetical protein [Pseudomonadota bacterium]
MLWIALAALLFLNYEAWIRDYPPAGPQTTLQQTGNAAPLSSTLGDTVPQAPSANAAAPAAAAALVPAAPGGSVPDSDAPLPTPQNVPPG